jgi:hypothetical protein
MESGDRINSQKVTRVSIQYQPLLICVNLRPSAVGLCFAACRTVGFA